MDDAGGAPELDPDELRAALRSPDPATRASALRFAGRASGVEEMVVWALSDPSDEVREAAVVGLARVAGTRAVARLARLAATDEAATVRAAAVRALGRIAQARIRNATGRATDSEAEAEAESAPEGEAEREADVRGDDDAGG